ncbi:hypothetical protein SERLADRAFT_437702 [Serpula lacrymans var. lacrymans S7.9]|uniref:Uncharacterized protein n=1 Tax=Serpula lacrymans var. lacrymans (strain S7.9) TaxID=578457 RepID=F8NV13_SERL9|nr:uncharacterized protein SERLADRAFT_437702 [Serpula lacrymans var. lacrymans S7.9]EGO25968.1 hypothetical protein SERLADRAFT_437702 [Serpula lacrymans var. lacrymans S7.9]
MSRILSTSRPGIHPTQRALEDSKPLRPLSSLNWPYVPEQSAYPDPLKRDDPKPLQLHQYEAIATSPVIRNILAKNPRLITLLTSLDSLQGAGREDALQGALGVHRSQTGAHQHQKAAESDEDVLALRTLTEAIEAAVRGEKEGTLDLDWGE